MTPSNHPPTNNSIFPDHELDLKKNPMNTEESEKAEKSPSKRIPLTATQSGVEHDRNESKSQTLMDHFPGANKDLKGVTYGSGRNRETFHKRSTVFGTTLE